MIIDHLVSRLAWVMAAIAIINNNTDGAMNNKCGDGEKKGSWMIPYCGSQGGRAGLKPRYKCHSRVLSFNAVGRRLQRPQD